MRVESVDRLLNSQTQKKNKKIITHIVQFKNVGLTVRSLGLPFRFQDTNPIVLLKTISSLIEEGKRKPWSVVYNR